MKIKKISFVFILLALFSSCRFDSASSPASTVDPGNENKNAATTVERLANENDPRNIRGKVVHISDGDTFVMEMAGGVRATVRIHAIDAPELAQDFGKQSRENLRALIANQQVQVRKQKLDQFQRVVGSVFLNGKDMGLQMVSDGYAWHFKQYEKEQPQAERAAYAAAEKNARGLQLGLWQDNDPLSPQDYRRTHERRKK